MIKHKKLEDPKLLFNISVVCVMIGAIGFGYIMTAMNYQVQDKQNELKNITDITSRYEFNQRADSNQMLKIASTYGAYAVLENLNSSRSADFKQDLRDQIYQAIVSLRGKKFSQSEKQYYDSLPFSELEKEYDTQSQRFLDEWNDLNLQKKSLERDIHELERKERAFSWIFITIQFIGLIFGFLSQIKRNEKEKII